MDVLTHKCPNCGGPLTFDPNDQKFHCDYCLNIYTEEEVSQYEQEQKEARGAQTQQTSAEENGADQFTFTAEEQLDQKLVDYLILQMMQHQLERWKMRIMRQQWNCFFVQAVVQKS